MSYKPLPIGIDDFEEIIAKDYYYVDKTLLIKELIDNRGKVNLFTRPRRFGRLKSLLLRYFFEKPLLKRIWKIHFRIEIMDAGDKYTCEGQYPVITLTLKSAKHRTGKNHSA